jgi:hypothetical protein
MAASGEHGVPVAVGAQTVMVGPATGWPAGPKTMSSFSRTLRASCGRGDGGEGDGGQRDCGESVRAASRFGFGGAGFSLSSSGHRVRCGAQAKIVRFAA